MRQKRHRALFTIITTNNARNGSTKRQAVYTGPYYMLADRDSIAFHPLRRVLPAYIVCLGILLGYLFTDLPSTRFFLTLPFALIMLFPLLFWAVSLVKMIRLPRRFTEVQRDQSFLSCIRSAYGLAVLCVLFIAGEIGLIASGGAGAWWPAETAWAAAMLVAGIAALQSAKTVKKWDGSSEKQADCTAATPHGNREK